jgi:hypothetical protein
MRPDAAGDPGQEQPPSRWRRWRTPIIVLGLTIILLIFLNHDHRLMTGETSEAAPPNGRVMELTLIDGRTDLPIETAGVRFGSFAAMALGSGKFAAGVADGARIDEVYAEGYRPLGIPSRRESGQALRLIPSVVEGRVEEAVTGAPIARATIKTEGATARSEADGRFVLEGVPANPYVEVSAPGFEAARLAVGDATQVDVALRQRELRAAYLTFYGVADRNLRERVVSMLNSGALNAVVLDVKGDLGYVLYKSSVPLAGAIGATDITPFPDAQQFVADLKSRGVYTIARIVVMKDDALARNGPRAGLDVAAKDSATGGVWMDSERLGWVDPFREEVWAYNIALAEEAIARGFDEVQFDYVRFPTDPGAGTRLDRLRYSQPATDESRPRAIAELLGRARQAVNGAGGYLAADIFGYVCWREDDMGIGQHLETLAPMVDYLNPMVYPSTFNGLPIQPSFTNSPGFPYETVFYSLQRAQERVAGTGVAIRPWLQYFDDYPWASGRRYGPTELAAQRRAVEELRLPGFMWWDPTNVYAHGPVVNPGRS